MAKSVAKIILLTIINILKSPNHRNNLLSLITTSLQIKHVSIDYRNVPLSIETYKKES